MNNRYVIKWKSKVNGRVGKGSKLFLREEAERLAEQLNREYPQIHHELADAEPSMSSQSEAEQSAPKPAHALSE